MNGGWKRDPLEMSMDSAALNPTLSARKTFKVNNL